MADFITSDHTSTQNNWSFSEMIEPGSANENRLIRLWNALTALPLVPASGYFVHREAARQSQLTSNVLFFFTVMVIALLPACFLAPGHSYFWLDLALAVASFFALVLNRKGHTLTAGILINLAGFLILTIALFTTVPFDETTLQGCDMYVIVELLAVSLLPMRSIFLVAVMSTLAILGTIVYMPHTAVLNADLHERLLIIIARPVGTLFLVAGVAYILASTMVKAIKRADHAEFIAQLQHEIAEHEHLIAEQKRELDAGIQQILQTHVAVANGSLRARAPLSHDNLLWQIARALNNLLVRYQRASKAEADLERVDQIVAYYVATIQQAEQKHQLPVLPFANTNIDPLIAALQGKTFGKTHLAQHASPEHVVPATSAESPHESFIPVSHLL
ncbi:MAG: hypothetical protein JO011_00130 [Ktedonobacteraceae bacterium]|nr:hypothetical protein [Ktedonobacteraceae bacterium]